MEKKKKLKYLISLGIPCLSLLQSVTVLAYNPDPPTAPGSYNIVDVATWDQMGYNGTVPPSKTNMGGFHWSEGCMTMSYATFMRKSGQRDKNWGPNDAFDELNNLGDYGGGQFPMARYNPGAKWGDWTLEGYEEGGLDGMTKAWEDGYGLVCMVAMGGGGRHVFTIDYIENGKVAMLDSGRRGVFIDDPGEWGAGSILGYYKLKSPDGTKGKDLPRLNDVRDGSNSKPTKGDKDGDDKKVSSSDVGDGGLVAEEDLVGMIKRNHYLYEYQIPVVLPGEAVQGDSALSKEQNTNAASIKEDVVNQKFNLIDFIRTVIAFMGIAIFVFGFALVVAYLFDKSNVYFEFSLISALTFGRYGVSHDKDVTQAGKTKLLKTAGIIKLFVFTEIIGWLLASGTVYSILEFIFTTVTRLVSEGTWW